MADHESSSLAASLIEAALGKKAEDIVQLDLRGLSDVSDLFVVMTGTSGIQIGAIADAVIDSALDEGRKPLHMEGRDLARWVLIDFVDVIVHIMTPEVRNFYGLERLWGDAPKLRFDDSGAPIKEPTTLPASEGEERS